MAVNLLTLAADRWRAGASDGQTVAEMRAATTDPDLLSAAAAKCHGEPDLVALFLAAGATAERIGRHTRPSRTRSGFDLRTMADGLNRGGSPPETARPDGR